MLIIPRFSQTLPKICLTKRRLRRRFSFWLKTWRRWIKTRNTVYPDGDVGVVGPGQPVGTVVLQPRRVARERDEEVGRAHNVEHRDGLLKGRLHVPDEDGIEFNGLCSHLGEPAKSSGSVVTIPSCRSLRPACSSSALKKLLLHFSVSAIPRKKNLFALNTSLLCSRT